MVGSSQLVTLEVFPDNPSADGRRSLARWLRSDHELRGQIRSIAVAGTIEPGHLSGGMELLAVALGSGGVVAVLVQAIAGWLTSRSFDATVRLTAENGTSIELDLRRMRDREQLDAAIEAARRALEDGDRQA